MAGDGNFKWWMAAYEDSEVWNGPYDNREQAVAQGTAEFDGDAFWVFEADKSVCRAAINAGWIAEHLIEDLIEHNDECWGEDGADDAFSNEAIKDLEKSLETLVADWLKRFPVKTWAAGDVRVTEQVVLDPARDAD